jgi:hypothetical protein
MKDQATVQKFIGRRAQGLSTGHRPATPSGDGHASPNSPRFLCRWRLVELVPPKFRHGLTKMKNVPVLFSFVQFLLPRTDVHTDFGPVFLPGFPVHAPGARAKAGAKSGHPPVGTPRNGPVLVRKGSNFTWPRAGRIGRLKRLPLTPAILPLGHGAMRGGRRTLA